MPVTPTPSSMTPFWNACARTDQTCGIVELSVLTAPAFSAAAKATLAKKCKDHYVSRKWLTTFGRKKLAAKLNAVLPVSKRQRSGDLGEILATEYVNRKEWDYVIPVLRLRWKDSRELPMRGEDGVGFNFGVKPIGLLKVEAKSRAVLKDTVLVEARTGLKKHKGRPAPFVISFIVERLLDDGNVKVARMIEDQTAGARLLDARELAHLLFVFSGNDPTALLKTNLTPLKSKGIRQLAVALHCAEHQAFIEEIFTEASRG